MTRSNEVAQIAEVLGMSEKKDKNPRAVHLGQLGGKARIKKITPEKRQEIARNAARARWAKERKKKQPPS
ncbi:MAG: hypothetical protein WA434_17970 [Candidatus Acidiferrales bacterium]